MQVQFRNMYNLVRYIIQSAKKISNDSKDANESKKGNKNVFYRAARKIKKPNRIKGNQLKHIHRNIIIKVEKII